ncbi:MAG: tetratricopeptide repeat protein [Rhodanobacter sp.]
MAARGWRLVLVAGFLLAGCAFAPPARKQVNLMVGESIEQNRANADVQQVVRGVQMIVTGQVQAAIDGPFDAVVNRYEAKYGHRKEIYFSARGTGDALLYSALPAAQKSSRSVVVLGPAWSMAYWGRGYAYNEMARYDDARVELKKALALAPFDAQYNVEIGYTYQQLHQWDESLEHFKTAAAFASITMAEGEVASVTCKALRGRGYDLVELHRYDEARTAYRGCLKLIPGEPKSLGELKYIDEVETRGKAFREPTLVQPRESTASRPTNSLIRRI